MKTKNIITTLLASVLFIVSLTSFSVDTNIEEDVFSDIQIANNKTQKIKDSTPYNDEYDFFTYSVNEITENYIVGVAVDNKKYDNEGIVLEKVDKVKKGDFITVVFDKDSSDNILDVIVQ